jgi:atypical dual specificity phosphatase
MGTWWIDEPFLLGSSNPSEKELGSLQDQGFTILVSLLDQSKQPPRYDVTGAAVAGWSCHSISIQDFHPPSLEQLRDFNALLEAAPPSARVLVHCEGGSGRTGTMAAAYWIKKGLTATEAIARLRKVRPNAVETCEQERVLYQYAELLQSSAKKT